MTNDTMFNDAGVEAIGLSEFRLLHPTITGKGVRFLQVEYDNDPGWSAPNAIYLPDGITPEINHHATEVSKVIRLIAPGVTLLNAHDRWFTNTLTGYYDQGGFVSTTPAAWDVENHSYTFNQTLIDSRIAQAQDERLVRDNVIAFAANGNSDDEVRRIWNASRQSCMCGGYSTPKGEFRVWDGTMQPYPDVGVPTQWSSIAAPVVAACAALLLELFPNRKQDIKKALEQTQVNGMFRIDLALALLGGSIEPPLTQEPMNLTKLAVIQPSVEAYEKVGEGLGNLTDGNPYTKCLHFNRDVSYFFSFQTAMFCDRVDIISANDYPQRDPQLVQVYSEESEGQWVLRREWLNVKFAARYERKPFDPIALSATARKWKVRCVSSTQSSPGDQGKGILQIAEMEFWGQGAYENPPPPPPPETLDADTLSAISVIKDKTYTAAQKLLLKAELNLIVATL